jgi:hypothetical protein
MTDDKKREPTMHGQFPFILKTQGTGCAYQFPVIFQSHVWLKIPLYSTLEASHHPQNAWG